MGDNGELTAGSLGIGSLRINPLQPAQRASLDSLGVRCVCTRAFVRVWVCVHACVCACVRKCRYPIVPSVGTIVLAVVIAVASTPTGACRRLTCRRPIGAYGA